MNLAFLTSGIMRIRLISVLLLINITSKVQSQALGANYNENIGSIDNATIIHSGVKWVRGFINVPRYFLNITSDGVVVSVNESGISEHTDIDKFIGLKEILVDGNPVNTILSLKLDFKYKDTGVPESDSPAMIYWMSAIEKLLKEKNLGSKIDILVVGNEPMWETENIDVDKLEVFLNTLIDLVYSLKIENEDWNYEIYTGALNRVDELSDKNAILQRIIKITKENNKVQGLDLHPHADGLDIIENDLNYIRNQSGINKKVLCTEVSIVRLWDNHRSDLLGDWGTQNGYSSSMKLYEWLNELQLKAAEGNPVSEEYFMSYFDTQLWYPQNWFLDVFDLICKYNVSVVTYGMQRELKNPPQLLTESSTLWILNFVYNAALFGIDTNGIFNTNPLVYPDFREIIERDDPCVINNLPANNYREELLVYPTLVENYLFVNSRILNKTDCYEIVALCGSIVYKSDFKGVPINVQNLPAGFYIIRFSGLETSAARFIKL
jgi:hypothetical protein